MIKFPGFRALHESAPRLTSSEFLNELRTEEGLKRANAREAYVFLNADQIRKNMASYIRSIFGGSVNLEERNYELTEKESPGAVNQSERKNNEDIGYLLRWREKEKQKKEQKNKLEEGINEFNLNHRCLNNYIKWGYKSGSDVNEKLYNLINVVKELTEDYFNGAYDTIKDNELLGQISDLEEKLYQSAKKFNYEYRPVSAKIIIRKGARELGAQLKYNMARFNGKDEEFNEKVEEKALGEAENHVKRYDLEVIPQEVLIKKKSFWQKGKERVKEFFGY